MIIKNSIIVPLNEEILLSQDNKRILEKELDTMYYSNSSLFLEHKYIRSVVMKFLPGLNFYLYISSSIF